MILTLKDGGIEEIYSDEWYEKGSCETCDFGSVNVSEYRFVLTDYTVEIKEEAEDQTELNEGYMMKLMLNNASEMSNMTEKEFCNWLEDKLIAAFDLKVSVIEN